MKLDILEESHREALRKAATKVVDAMHGFKPDAILLCGTSSQPAFSLVAEAWRRRYPGKPLPRTMPVTMAKHSDVKEKRIVLFDEIVVTGISLQRAREAIEKFSPAKVRKIALIQQLGLKKKVTSGAMSITLAPVNLNWLLETDLRRWLRYDGIKEEKRRIAAAIRQRRAEFRQIASSIKPRKTLWQRMKSRLRIE